MNILTLPEINLENELFETLLCNEIIRIERIISTGQVSPDDFWYDQEESEWILVLEGEAEIMFHDKSVKLTKGDCLLISAHSQHRVTYTANPTIWLAVFY